MSLSTISRRLLIPALFAMLFIVISCDDEPTQVVQDNSTVQGVISDEQNFGVPNAVVQVVTPEAVKVAGKILESKVILTTKTDEDGKFAIDKLPHDLSNLQLRIYHENDKYKRFSENLQSIIAGKDRHNIALSIMHDTDCKGRIEILVKKRGDSSAYQGVEVRLKKNGELIRKSYTGDGGRLVFENVCPGEYKLRLSKSVYVLEPDTTISITSEENISLTYLMEADTCCNNQIKIYIKNNGNDLSGASVKLWRGGTLVRSVTSESNPVTFGEVCKGTYGISINKKGYYAQEFQVTVDCGQVYEFTKELEQDTCCRSMVTLQVRDSSGNLLDNVLCYLYKDGYKIGDFRTNMNGQYILRDLCKGHYKISLHREDLREQYFEFDLGCSDTVTYDRVMEPARRDSCCNGVVVFTVKNGEGVYLPEVTVYVWKNGTKISAVKTDAMGKYTFRGVCEGTYQFSFFREGYKGQEFSFSIGCDDTLYLEKTMEPAEQKDTCCRGEAKIIIKDDSTRLPVKGATVKIWKSGKMLGYYTTDDYGIVTFRELCKGEYAFDVIKDAYKSIEFALTFDCNEKKEIEKFIKLEANDSCCNGTIQLEIKDKQTGQAINGGTAKLRKNGTVLSYQTITNGLARFTKLCEGVYGFLIVREGYVAQEFEVRIGCNENKEISVQFQATEPKDTCCRGQVKVVVRDSATGEFLQYAWVYLYKGSTKIAYNKTDANGVITFGELCKGDYSISIQRELYKGIEFAFSLDCNEKKEFEKYIAKKPTADSCCTARIKVKVIENNDSATAIQGATVRIMRNGETIQTGTTNAEGWAAFDGLCSPSSYRVVVNKDGYAEKVWEVTFKECNLIQETLRLLR